MVPKGRAFGQPDEKRIRACVAAASTASDTGPGVEFLALPKSDSFQIYLYRLLSV